jgi:hypothetical protein
MSNMKIDVKRSYDVGELVGFLTRNRYSEWSDEHSVCRDVSDFIVVFYAKYCGSCDFSFYLWVERKRYFIIARNISGFEYRFPLIYENK